MDILSPPGFNLRSGNWEMRMSSTIYAHRTPTIYRLHTRLQGPPPASSSRIYANSYEQVFPTSRSSHSVGPGIEVREDPFEARRRDGNLDDLTSME
jgi:hypothetical protein